VRKVNFGEPGSRQGLSVGEDGCTLVKERVKVNDYKNYTEKRRLKTDKDKRRFEGLKVDRNEKVSKSNRNRWCINPEKVAFLKAEDDRKRLGYSMPHKDPLLFLGRI